MESPTYVVRSIDDSDCLEGVMKDNIVTCTSCAAGLTLLDGICYVNLVRKHGTCVQHKSNIQDIRCLKCEESYKGQFCDRCVDGFVLISGDCYKNVNDKNGLCILKDGFEQCISCSKGYKHNEADRTCTTSGLA